VTYTGDLPPQRFNLARYCLAGRLADKTALIVAGSAGITLSYGALEDMVLRMAEGLRQLGLTGGARIMLRVGNSLDHILLFFAANAAGAVPIPTSPLLTAIEAEAIRAAARPAFIAWDGMVSLPSCSDVKLLGPDDIGALKSAPRGAYADTAKDDPAYIAFTSGTSGSPTGVIHAQRAVWGRRPMYRGWYGIRPDDVMLHTGAFNWTYTMGTGLMDPFANGATAIIYAGPRDDGVWRRLIAEHGATLFASVPGIYRQLMRNGFRPGPTLRHALCAGEALAPSLLSAWRAGTGVELYEALGMSEISTYVSSGPDVPIKPGSPGKPQPGRAIRILDSGEIGVHRGDPGLMLGYLDGSGCEGEWFATGDAAEIDADGYVWHHGRLDDLMNASGYRVSPVEVERELLLHPAVVEAGVTEVRISESLTIIGAFVVPHEGAEVDENSILAFLRERLASYKCPKQVWFRPRLPRSANGKLLRRALAT
jgi:4-hydroxybenzoate-CoA ligase